MSHDPRRFPPLPYLGLRSEPSLFESGDYTSPDGLDGPLSVVDDLFVPSDFDDGEPTTITRHGWR